MPVFLVEITKTLRGGSIIGADTEEEAKQLTLKLPPSQVCWDDLAEIEVILFDLTDLK
jgi:hypothetical protein